MFLRPAIVAHQRNRPRCQVWTAPARKKYNAISKKTAQHFALINTANSDSTIDQANRDATSQPERTTCTDVSNCLPPLICREPQAFGWAGNAFYRDWDRSGSSESIPLSLTSLPYPRGDTLSRSQNAAAMKQPLSPKLQYTPRPWHFTALNYLAIIAGRSIDHAHSSLAASDWEPSRCKTLYSTSRTLGSCLWQLMAAGIVAATDVHSTVKCNAPSDYFVIH